MTEAAARVFASHYQLMICDDPRRGVPEDANWSDKSFRCGFAGDLRTRLVGTEADVNDHWVEVTTAATPPDASSWQRITLVHFYSDTGKIHVMSVVDDTPRISMEIGVGDLSVYVAAKNIGIDLLALNEDGELTDEQLAVRKDLEWYRIFVVPGRPGEEGRIKEGRIKDA